LKDLEKSIYKRLIACEVNADDVSHQVVVAATKLEAVTVVLYQAMRGFNGGSVCLFSDGSLATVTLTVHFPGQICPRLASYVAIRNISWIPSLSPAIICV
jgi:hypothetical protein